MAQLDETAPLTREQTVGVIGRLTRTSGFMGARQQLYTLVVTDRRVIFAELTRDRMRQLSLEADARARRDGKGRLGRAGAQLHARDGVAATYWAMTPDEALRETPTNFAIDRSAIRKLKFKTGVGDAASDRVIIKTAGETYKLQGVLRSHKDQFAAVGLTR
jgi:hypothetical protein